jgi:hypothetical protein
MKEYKHLSVEERQQMTFDWRYRGFTVLELLTEDESKQVLETYIVKKKELPNGTAIRHLAVPFLICKH